MVYGIYYSMHLRCIILSLNKKKINIRYFNDKNSNSERSCDFLISILYNHIKFIGIKKKYELFKIVLSIRIIINKYIASRILHGT